MSTFAIIKSGGKQYQVAPGMQLKIEKVSGEVGDTVSFNDVLLVADGTEAIVGKPYVTGATVNSKIVKHGKGKKLIIFKKIRRKGKQLKKGHRQQYTCVQVENIVKA